MAIGSVFGEVAILGGGLRRVNEKMRFLFWCTFWTILTLHFVCSLLFRLRDA